jgi:putative phage-type endonuclease
MSDPDFHARRLTGLGGDDAAAALGLSPYRTPSDVFVQKKTPLEAFAPRIPTEPMIWGTLMQPVILGEYVRRTGYVVEAEPEMLRHDKYTWMIAHLDGRVVNGRIVEIKTSRDGHGWGEPGSDEIPMHYACQVHHYLVVSGAELCDLAVLIGGSDFRIYTIHADAAIAAELVGREAEFWQRVEQNNPPDPVNLDDARARWGKLLIEGAVQAGEGELRAIETMRWCREQSRTLQAAEADAKLTLLQALGERGDTLVDATGTRLCTWALDRGRKAYTVEAREPARRFLLK